MGELEVEEFRDVLGCQQLERQLLTHSLALEVELQRPKRMLRDLQLRRPVRRDDQHLCRVHLIRDVAQNVDG